MLPPHEIVARGSAILPKTTFSVLEGVGRRLKGRDLNVSTATRRQWKIQISINDNNSGRIRIEIAAPDTNRAPAPVSDRVDTGTPSISDESKYHRPKAL